MSKRFTRFVACLLVAASLAAMPVVAFAASHEHYDSTTPNGLTANMEEIVEKTTEGTCSHGESKTYKCKICGYQTLALTKPRDYDGPGSAYVKVDDQSDDEKVTFKCTTCGDVRVAKIHAGIGDPSDPTKASAHEWVDHVQAPTCTAYGYTYQTCNVDGCTLTHIVSSSYVAPAHNFNDWKITKYATSGADGVEQHTCLTCGHVETRSTDKTVPAAYTARIKEDLTPVYTEASTAKPAAYLLAKGFTFTPVSTFHEKDEWCEFTSTELGTGNFFVKTANIELNPGNVPLTTAYVGLKYVGTVKSSVPLKARLSSSTDSAELYSLPYNSTLYIYQKKSDGWMKISPNKDEWVYGTTTGDTPEISLIQVIGAGEIPAEDTRKVIDTGVVTAAQGIKVHKAANTASDTVEGTLPKGTKITFYEKHVADTTGKNLKWGVILKADYPKYGLTATEAKLYVDLSYVSLTSLGGGTAAGDAQGTGTVSTSIPLNVRKDPKVTPTNKVGSLTNGTKVTLYEIKDGWGRIDQDGLKGWICLQYVIMDGASSAGGATAAEANAKIVNCATVVNVRSQAKVTSALVSTIPVNTRVAVTKKDGQWYYVANRGWVYGDYISLDEGALTSGSTGTTSAQPIITHTNVTVVGVVKATGTLNMYATPNPSSTVVAKLPNGTEFTIVDRTIADSQIWAKVALGDTIGWVKADSANVTYPAVTGTITSGSLSIYSAPSIDSSIKGTVGAGTKVSIAADKQTVDGVYVWGKLSSVDGYVMLHQLKLDVKPVGTVESLTTNPAITGTIKSSTDMKATPSASAATILVLEKDAKVTVTEWKYSGTTTYGKVTKGDFTGWIDVSKIEQAEITGTVNVDMVNLYATKDATEIQKVLRNGAKVTIIHRELKDNAVWGKVRTSEGNEYWGNMAGIALAGATATTTPATTTTTTTTTTPAATAGTPGVVFGAPVVNVRKAAGVRNELATTLPQGTAVTVTERTTVDGAEWGHIAQGWIAMQYVNLNAGAAAGTTTSGSSATNVIMTSVPAGAIAVGFVDNTTKLQVRSQPYAGASVVGSLVKKANVVIYEQQLHDGAIWGRIGDGKWVCTSYVTLTAIGSTGTGELGTVARTFYTANIRSMPSSGNTVPVVGKVMVNSRVEIYEQKTSAAGELWGRTAIGWINMQYIATGTAPII